MRPQEARSERGQSRRRSRPRSCRNQSPRVRSCLKGEGSIRSFRFHLSVSANVMRREGCFFTGFVWFLIILSYSPMIKVPSAVTLTYSCLSPGSRMPEPCPSFIQNSVGGGLPVARQSNLAVEPLTSRWSDGRITKMGGAEKMR